MRAPRRSYGPARPCAGDDGTRPVTQRQPRRLDAEIISEPQPPHQHDGAQHAVVLPAPAGGDDRLADAKRPAQALEPPRYSDVLHQRQVGKAADGRKCLAGHKDRLIAAGDTGQPRAPIDHAGDDRQERMPSGNAQIEAAPSAVHERRGNQAVGIWRQRRIGMQEKQHIAATERGARIQRRRRVRAEPRSPGRRAAAPDRASRRSSRCRRRSISAPRARNGASAVSASTRMAASLSTGTTMVSRRMTPDWRVRSVMSRRRATRAF